MGESSSITTCPNPEKADQDIINIDFNAGIDLNICLDAYIDLQVAALAAAGFGIRIGNTDFKFDLMTILEGLDLPEIDGDNTCPINGPIGVKPSTAGGPRHPLLVFTTQDIVPIIVTTALPTTVVPLNPLSSVSPTPPPTPPPVETTTVDPSIPPVIGSKPTNPPVFPPIPPGSTLPPGTVITPSSTSTLPPGVTLPPGTPIRPGIPALPPSTTDNPCDDTPCNFLDF